MRNFHKTPAFHNGMSRENLDCEEIVKKQIWPCPKRCKGVFYRCAAKGGTPKPRGEVKKMAKKNNNKLVITIPGCTYNAVKGFVTTEEKHEAIDVLKACQDETIVSKEMKKEALKTIKKIEKECSSEMIEEFNNLLTSLYSIALEDGFNRF